MWPVIILVETVISLPYYYFNSTLPIIIWPLVTGKWPLWKYSYTKTFIQLMARDKCKQYKRYVKIHIMNICLYVWFFWTKLCTQNPKFEMKKNETWKKHLVHFNQVWELSKNFYHIYRELPKTWLKLFQTRQAPFLIVLSLRQVSVNYSDDL